LAEGLQVAALRKAHGPHRVLEDISFAVSPGESLVLLGASGAGKTTVLNLIAGLDRPDAGEIRLGGRLLCGQGNWVPPQRRGIGMVFQDQLLWPHLTVAEHVDFVLRARGVPRAERPLRVRETLDAAQLSDRDSARPGTLSGGERQRLGLARALAAAPSLLLLDEPTANLDAPLKSEILTLLLRLRRKNGFAAVHVTHDSAEALLSATQLAILDAGRVAQVGTLRELLAQPAGPAVARALGGALLPGEWVDEGALRTALGVLAPVRACGPAVAGRRALAWLPDGALRAASEGPLSATVLHVYPDLDGWMALLDAGGTSLRARLPGAAPSGQVVHFTLVAPAVVLPGE
jgi:iron(III) transport system ATP-binding protein